MPRSKTALMDWIRRNSPRREDLLESRWIKPFGHRVAHSHLWRFTRTSVPRGVALGLFVGIFLLIPGIQIIGVALLALPVRANIPIGAAMTFLSNPLTTPFLCAAAVWIGNGLFGLHADITALTLLWEKGASVSEWLSWIASDVALAFVPGLFVISALAAIVGYILASIGWDNWIRLRWRRKLNRARGDQPQ
jgi:uncharacterized protein